MPGGQPRVQPLHVPLPHSAPLPPFSGAVRGPASPWDTAGKGCPIEGSLQGHCPTRRGVGLGGQCWRVVALRG